ncbi:MAG: transporter permease, partial [Sporomusa sp.]|nr:transporter permease [Sporomusa sp.]
QLTNMKGDIEFRHVTFHYIEGSPIIKNFDLKIQSGTTVALVGPTGVGKTTLVSLLNRFYDPVQGSILIDNCDLKDVSLKSLRDNVSMVLQDVYLFTGTVFENIAYSCRNATKEQIITVAQKAQAHEFIMDLEHGYDTYIGERGVKLSGGQKQRLAIARALLRDAPILLLDEATSALDNQTEAAIQQALSILSAGRTTLMIAHRLSTIKSADQIVVLEGTGVAEQGTHETLLKKKGIYARLHAAQDI